MYFKNLNTCEIGCSMHSDNHRIITKDYDYNSFDENFEYYICKYCNNILLKFVPDLSEVKNIYPKSYGAYDSNNFGFFGQIARNIAASIKCNDILKIKTDIKSAIEFGCGSQPLITKLKTISNCQITLCDIYLDKKLLVDNFIVGNIEDKIKSINNKFDLIVFNQVLEHLTKPIEFLNNCDRILNNNGIIYFDTPNSNGYDARFFLKDGTWGGLHAPRHFTIFNNESIEKIMRSRYSYVKIKCIFNPFMLNASFKNTFTKKGFLGAKNYLKISNPIILFLYIAFDFIAIIFGYKTGNMNVICKK